MSTDQKEAMDLPSGRVEYIESIDRFDIRYDLVGPRAALDEFLAWIEERYPRGGYSTMLYGVAAVGDGEGPWRGTVTRSRSCD